MSSFKEIAKGGYHFLRATKNVVVGIPAAIKMGMGESYFPEKQSKTTIVKVFDNLGWLLKYHEVNDFYYLYGMDLVGSKDDDTYQDYLHFMITRAKYNRIGQIGSQVVLLRDKFLFYKYMSANGMPVPEVFGVYKAGNVYDNCMNHQSIDWLEKKSNYFVKDIDGECASFVKRIKDFSDFSNVREQLDRTEGGYILQYAIAQCKEMSELNPKAINTLRIVTVNDGKSAPYVLSVLLRVGTSATNNVDNWAAGGLAIGVEKNGYLSKYGFYKPKFGKKISQHPDTKIEFSKFKVPMYDEALKLACKAHTYFYGVHSIGWDVALTPNGPMFIEGNDNWEISLMQACSKGLKKEWMKSFPNIKQ